MNNFISQLSKGTLALLAIGGGILFIVLRDPPRSICDSQVNQFKEKQIGFLFPDPKRLAGQVRQTRLKRESDFCKVRNSPGACYELFSSLKILVKELDFLDSRCKPDIASLGPVRSAVFSNLELMTLLAWGERPPVNYYAKLNWFSGADMKLFCDLKRIAYDFYGESAWNAFREKMLKSVPGVNELSRENAWNVILLSTKCETYL
ncbi:MAG: hypothetical protein CL677_09130 [Bdellovibrionaceae bacterium]|nr:hypothetical protein [Pseudobdellovibrionaceae bacterium]|tara:strand:+ start:779 stop:1393 length:615 start_codon:yes stop_codon:yes gene_type:complete